MRRGRLALFAWAVLALAGCAQFDTGSAARRQASTILDCDEEDVAITQVGAYRYRGEGCGGSVEVVCTAAALEPTCYRQGATSSSGGEQYDDDDDAFTGEGAPGGEGRRPPPDDATGSEQARAEAQIRAGLDARREDILACVGRERVAVGVAYGADGEVEITLQGPLGGSAEEGCVQSALAGVRVAPTGASGRVVHLVR